MRRLLIALMLSASVATLGACNSGSSSNDSDPVIDACNRASSPSADREAAWEELSSLEPGYGIGPAARLLIRATAQGNHTAAAQWLSSLQTACSAYENAVG
jgi:hypothetical protein